jgi:hypothetical protein
MQRSEETPGTPRLGEVMKGALLRILFGAGGGPSDGTGAPPLPAAESTRTHAPLPVAQVSSSLHPHRLDRSILTRDRVLGSLQTICGTWRCTAATRRCGSALGSRTCPSATSRSHWRHAAARSIGCTSHRAVAGVREGRGGSADCFRAAPGPGRGAGRARPPRRRRGRLPPVRVRCAAAKTAESCSRGALCRCLVLEPGHSAARLGLASVLRRARHTPEMPG